MQDYHKLLVWKRAFTFVQHVYQLTLVFPKEERFGLANQFRRAAVSVVANIVEGRGKATNKDFVRFLYIAKGSLNECQCYLELAHALDFISTESFNESELKRGEVGYLLFKLIKRLE